MEKVLYTKISEYRGRCFNLKTEIVDIGGKHFAKKTPMYPEGVKHIDNLYKNTEKFRQMMAPRSSVCGVRREGDALYFEYVEGKSFEEQISEAAESGKIEAVFHILDTYHELVYKMLSQKGFRATAEFEQVFGRMQDAPDLDTGSFVNVDLIFRNIISANVPYVIDCEWCFDFPIPLKYVFWRGLFTSMGFAGLPDDVKREVYSKYDLDEDTRKRFLEMEGNFVRASKGEALSLADETEAIHQPVFDLRRNRWLEESYPLIVFAVKDGNARKIYESVSYPGYNSVTLETDGDYDRLEFFIAPLFSILSDIHVSVTEIGGSREVAYSTTSEGDDQDIKFFLKNTPVVLVNERVRGRIQVRYTINVWAERSLSEEVLDGYLSSVGYACDAVRLELDGAHRELDGVHRELEVAHRELDACNNLITQLRRRNIFVAMKTFKELRKENSF